MVDILLQTLPFFALIGLGYGAGATGFFSEEATAHLTKFVFYFALSAMLFRFSANLSISEIFDPDLVLAYLSACIVVYVLATIFAVIRRVSMAEAAIEAQCAVIGNVGFLGIPMLTLLLGEQAIGTVLLVLSTDLIVFGSLIVILVTASRGQGVSIGILGTVGMGLLKNPMIMSIAAGLLWSSTGWTIPQPANDFLYILGSAATPGALFAIGASLAGKTAERISVAAWLSFAKLVLHPAAAAVSALLIFEIAPAAAAAMIASAALPVAGNVFILAQHYGVAPQRVSAAILLSTLASIVTLTAVIAWVNSF